jgi:enoyl-CoA hydratase/carnithine racemase
VDIRDFTDIIYEKEDNGICTATISRPERRNAISQLTWLELETILADMEQDINAKVLIITGDPKGRAFSSGGYFDPKATQMIPENIKKEIDFTDMARIKTVNALFNFPKPVIAAINGLAIGGGITMPLVGADLIYMAEDAWIGFYFVKRGVIAEFAASFLLPFYVGFQKAKELVYFGDKITAQQALEFRIVNKVLPNDELIPYAREQALRLIPPKGPSRAINLMKKTMHAYFLDIVNSTVGLENEGWKKLINSEDMIESTKALKERREPVFKGK